jgi:hypothetical protein
MRTGRAWLAAGRRSGRNFAIRFQDRSADRSEALKLDPFGGYIPPGRSERSLHQRLAAADQELAEPNNEAYVTGIGVVYCLSQFNHGPLHSLLV